ncbi:MAG: tRNA modification GTPase [Gemmatales bacterium]|nr:tRNA modification GTPase [Gemmatales bacterium]MDW8386546.1 tRNA modification GTPase [Gemmatales bacterium]
MTRLPDPRDTIAAISSAPGRAMRAIIRLTGPDSFRILGHVCPSWRKDQARQPERVTVVTTQAVIGGVLSRVASQGRESSDVFSDRPAYAGRSPVSEAGRSPFPKENRSLVSEAEPSPVLDANFSPVLEAGRSPNGERNQLLLPVTLLIWPAPRTYTGQDLAEFHTFGSPPLTEALLSAILDAGARLAQPGEFTLRAFLAGKLDLSQTEALLDLLHANDFGRMQLALTRLAGGIGKPLQAIRGQLLDLLAEIEAELDFSEEDLTFLPPYLAAQRLRQAEEQLAEVEKRLTERNTGAGAFRVVLAGPPNAGKSSLFNALIGESAALVSPTPGTTRDWLERTVTWNGVEIALVDAAGTGGQPVDPLDRLAREATSTVLEEADLVLLCHPADTSEGTETNTPLSELPADRTLPVMTKCDLTNPRQDQRPLALPTSVVTGAGLDALRDEIVRQAIRRRGGFVSASRCRPPIRSARDHLVAAAERIEHRQPELAAMELRSALEALGEIVGEVCTEELLDRIFSQFCIGK